MKGAESRAVEEVPVALPPLAVSAIGKDFVASFVKKLMKLLLRATREIQNKKSLLSHLSPYFFLFSCC